MNSLCQISEKQRELLVAFDSHPKYMVEISILFLSDRSGGNNAWIIDRKKEDTVQLTKGIILRCNLLAESPDGDYVVVSKGTRNFKTSFVHKNEGTLAIN